MKLLKSENKHMDLYSWGNGRRINASSDYLKKRYGTRIQKLTIDAGFTCPNRDGTKGYGGCHFCNNEAFNPSYCNPEKSVKQQIEEGKSFHKKRYRRSPKYLAYFQAFSNTYASLNRLKQIYSEALQQEDVIGLIIGTRPDCIDEMKLDYLAWLSKKYYVVVEYGIESINNRTLNRINRCHSFEESLEALELTGTFGVNGGAHFIFGLPGETRDEILNSVDIISSLPLHSIKIHQLQILRGTRFASDYENDPSKFDLFSLDEYIDLLVRFLSKLNPGFIIERLAAETQPWNSVTEISGMRYDQVLGCIERRMEERDLWQGKYYVH